ncbi:hypothetical protein D3C85_1287180 [compost metagenome]
MKPINHCDLLHITHLKLPNQLLQLIGVEPHRFRTALHHNHSLAHLRGRLLDLLDRLTVVEAALVELLRP